MKKHVAKFFKHPYIQSIMEFPVLFLGALPENTPALYSLMNYADIKGGTWYPEKGMYSIVHGMYQVAIEQGVTFCFGEEVKQIEVVNGVAKTARTIVALTGAQKEYSFDVVVGAGDYHHIETKLLSEKYQSYSDIWPWHHHWRRWPLFRIVPGPPAHNRHKKTFCQVYHSKSLILPLRVVVACLNPVV